MTRSELVIQLLKLAGIVYFAWKIEIIIDLLK